MAYEPKDGSGALFKSDKGENPNRPDYRGDIMLGGVLYEVSGWIKPKPSNLQEKFMSLSGKPKQAAPAPKPQPMPSAGFDDMDKDIPF
jgi:hypothetical protein